MSDANTWYYGNAIDVSGQTGYWDSWYKAAAYFKAIDDTDDTYKIRIYGSVYFNEWSGWASSSLNIDGTEKVKNAPIYSPTTGFATNGPWTKDITITKTSSVQTKSYSTTTYCGGGAWSSVSLSVSVPAKTSYTISYSANGGSGAPDSQTKWYGESLTLSSTVPTRTGYAFLGWSTSSTATTATYAAGGSYTTNAAATLYAVWEAQVASITSASDITLGSSTTITWSTVIKPSQYKIKLYLGNWEYTTPAYIRVAANGSTTQTWNYTVPKSVTAQFTTSKTATMGVVLYTYSGTTDSNAVLLGSSTSTFTVTAPSDATPTMDISNIQSLVDGNNAIYNTFKAGSSTAQAFFIKGFSSVKASISLQRTENATGNLRYNATLKSVKLEVGSGTSYGFNKLSTVTVSASGNTAVVTSDILNPTIATSTAQVRMWYRITITDSRGYTKVYSNTSGVGGDLLYIQNYWTPSGSIMYEIQEDHSIKTTVGWSAASVQSNNNLILILTRESAGETVAILNMTPAVYASGTSYSKGTIVKYRTSTSNPYYIYEYIYATAASGKTPSSYPAYWSVIGKVDQDGGLITTDSYEGTYVWNQSSINDANMKTYSYSFTVRDATNTNIYTTSTGLVCISRHRGGKGVTFFADASSSEIADGGLWANSIRLDLTLAEYTSLATSLAETWSSSTAYTIGDFCTYTVSGTTHTYEAIAAGTNKTPTNTSYWAQLV